MFINVFTGDFKYSAGNYAGNSYHDDHANSGVSTARRKWKYRIG
jgi:hypothetical protein